MQPVHIILLVGTDYNGPRQQQVFIPAGSTATSATFVILNDKVTETKEEFNLIIEPAGSVQLGSPAEAVVYIVDDDCELFIILSSIP